MKFENMSKADFMKLTTRPDNMGGLLDCIHIIGTSKFEKFSDEKAEGHHQVYVYYRRWTDKDKKEVEVDSEGLLIMTHHYIKIDGVWKLNGTTPRPRLGDLKLAQVFKA